MPETETADPAKPREPIMSVVNRLDAIDFSPVPPPTAAPARAASVRAVPEVEANRPAAGDAPPAAEERSEAQLLFDRLLAQCNRFNRIRKQLEQINSWIAPHGHVRSVFPEASPGATTHPTSFFDGLHMLADGNDQVAEELERTLHDLAGLF